MKIKNLNFVILALLFFTTSFAQAKEAKPKEVAHNVVQNAKVIEREYKDFYIYEVQFTGYKKEDFKIEQKGGDLTISAVNKVQSDDKRVKRFADSNFTFSSSVSDYDKNKEAEITRQDDKVTVKIFKKKSNY